MLEIHEKETWEGFPFMQDKGLFLQSFHQKELYESLGQRTWLFEVTGIRSLVTKIEAKRGTFLFLPYGPMPSDADSEAFTAFFTELRTLAQEEGASFIRVSPYWEETDEKKALLVGHGFRPAPIHMLAETLWVLDLEGKTDEQLLEGMEKKHRNLVRRAIKDGVEISRTTTPEAVDRFVELHWETRERHQFTPYPKDFFRNQVRLFAEDDQVLVIEATHGGELLASAIIMTYGKVGAYHHGASSSNPEHRKIPASYLIQWEAIQEARRRGCSRYNFWGVAPYRLDAEGKRVYENLKHPFCGITHFKTGFGGHRVDLLPCHDLVVNARYYLNWSIEKVRKWKRGF
ncbi:MAG: peptidoglycan bridge formation glycyltransferase FemA/FemB family protein [bacterium]|nr:peptidoglycan bridge formation glycyltransferase FemA/FemB family protein [bacterium]